MESWFTWKGVDSRSMGLIVQSTPPIVLPSERVEQLTIPGRPGVLLRTQGPAVYEPYLKTVTLANRRGCDMQAVAAWLRGSGLLIFSSEPDYAYEGRVLKEVSLPRLFPGVWSGTVSWLVQPCKQASRPSGEISADMEEDSLLLFNPGDVPSRPLIRITGSGLVSVTVTGDDGATVYVQTGESGTGAVVDVDAMMVTTPDGSESLNGKTSLSVNGFPGLRLPPGFSTITWSTDTVTALSVDPRWRWL